MGSEIKATFINSIDDPLFENVAGHQKEEIKEDLKNHHAVVIRIDDHKIPVLAFVLVEYYDCLYIFKMVGTIGKYWAFAQTFIEAWARIIKRDKIIFETERPAIRGFAEKSGYVNTTGNEFVKVI